MKEIISVGRNSLSFTKCILSAALVATTIQAISSFQIAPTPNLMFGSFPSTVQKRKNSRSILFESGRSESEAAEQQKAYDSLYEFLTKRSGQEAGASTDRERKRDRIRKWVSKSKSSTNMVQPLSVEDGSVMEDLDTAAQPTRLGRLWNEMPTLDDILSRRQARVNNNDTNAKTPGGKQGDWFDAEKRQIQAEYDEILRQIKQQISDQRRQDPQSVPANSESIAESIVDQELKRMLSSVKTTRAKERLQDMEIERMADLNRRDFSQDNDELAKKLLQEAAEEWKRQEAAQANMDDYQRYANKALERMDEDDGVSAPQPGSDLDAWALERLEDMLEKTAKEGGDVSISDILEDNIEVLQEGLDKESKRVGVEARTMKEWQMYRAIATRLTRRKDNSGISDPLLNQEEVDEQLIQKQLNLWREYIGKEADIRKRSGLTAGPKMPFDWHSAKQREEGIVPATAESKQEKSRSQIRREINLQAIDALEDLIQKSDPMRAENLQKQLDSLKEELEPLDYLDAPEESFVDEEIQGSVDLSDVFRSESEEIETTIDQAFSRTEQENIEQMMSGKDYVVPGQPPKTPFFEDMETKPEPPKTPFFEDIYEEPVPTAPDTPFFADDSVQEEPTVAASETTDSKLGSIEEQKLTNMFRRAGARTKKEQDKIREEWQAFQDFEKTKRDASGLSNADDESLLQNAKYDVSEIMTKDGDIDAAKVLASIGPRPVRKKKSAPTVTDESSDSSSPSVDPSDVSDAMYRSVSAVGGGRSKDDPSIRDEEKAAFEEYMEKEEELRQSLNDIDESASKLATEGVKMYDESYAKNALESMAPRPAIKRKRKRVMDEMEYSDKGGVLYSEDESLSDRDDEGDAEENDGDDLFPNWIKKERRDREREKGSGSNGNTDPYFSGNKMDDVFEDDKYDHNLRQLAEYKHRRAGNKKQQMGIDISDILLGRQQSDDYADYNYDADYFRGQQGGWQQEVSFEARKATLLEYIELSVAELNNLFDHKESAFSNGASQYIPRINKPFSEFGAIFRVEGVMFDLTGIHNEVWAKVAQEFGYRAPQFEDIEHAAVAKPEFSIRRIFCWTNDMIEVNNVNKKFLEIFRESFDRWALDKELKVATDETIDPPAEQNTRGFLALGEDVIGASQPIFRQQQTPPIFTDERTKMMKVKESWAKTATHYEVAPPSNEQIAQCSFLSPDIAVRDVFRWTSNQQEIDLIVSYYSQLLAGLEPVDRRQNTAAPSSSGSISEMGSVDVLELQFFAWEKVAKQASLQVPTPEEVLAASVLNDPVAVIAHGFGWTKDITQIEELATQYRDTFAQLVNERIHNRSYRATEASVQIGEKPTEIKEASSAGPTAEEVLRSQIEAWDEVAREHGLLTPAHSQIELAMNMSPSDSVRRLLGWTHNFNNDQINTITASYEAALKKSFSKVLNTYDLETEEVHTNDRPQTDSNEVSADELFKAAIGAWANVADRMSFPAPNQEQVIFAMTVGPEEAILSGFGWADNMSDAANISADYREEIKLKRAQWHREGMTTNAGPTNGVSTEETAPLVKIMPGAESWIHSLNEVEMRCGIISHLEGDQVQLLLEYAGLSGLLPRNKRVTSEQGYDRDNQQMLGASLRIDRRPDHCVVFDSSPQANIATQEINMRSVSMVGPYPRYELLTADTTAFSFDELTAMNIRRLFGERVYDQPMLDVMQKVDTVKRTKTRLWDPED